MKNCNIIISGKNGDSFSIPVDYQSIGEVNLHELIKKLSNDELLQLEKMMSPIISPELDASKLGKNIVGNYTIDNLKSYMSIESEKSSITKTALSPVVENINKLLEHIKLPNSSPFMLVHDGNITFDINGTPTDIQGTVISGDFKTLVFRFDKNSPQNSLKNLEHELIHYVFDDFIGDEKHPDYDKDLVSHIKGLYDITKSNFTNKSGSFKEVNGVMESIDSGATIREFVAYALTDSKFQNFLKSINYDKGLSMFDAIQATVNAKLNNPTKIKKDADNIVPQEYTNHSGGAEGSDIEWDRIGREYGVTNHVHYWMNNKTPHGNKEITNEDLSEGQKKVTIAARQMGRISPTHQVRDERLIRNWSQVKYADEVFAITSLLSTGDEMNYGKKALIPQGKGGTGYAIQMAINEGKKVHVFDQIEGKWYYANSQPTGTQWVEEDTPVLTKNFAGIGTRSINNVGKQAIRDVYENTFKGIKEAPFTDEEKQEAGSLHLFLSIMDNKSEKDWSKSLEETIKNHPDLDRTKMNRLLTIIQNSHKDNQRIYEDIEKARSFINGWFDAKSTFSIDSNRQSSGIQNTDDSFLSERNDKIPFKIDKDIYEEADYLQPDFKPGYSSEERLELASKVLNDYEEATKDEYRKYAISYADGEDFTNPLQLLKANPGDLVLMPIMDYIPKERRESEDVTSWFEPSQKEKYKDMTKYYPIVNTFIAKDNTLMVGVAYKFKDGEPFVAYFPSKYVQKIRTFNGVSKPSEITSSDKDIRAKFTSDLSNKDEKSGLMHLEKIKEKENISADGKYAFASTDKSILFYLKKGTARNVAGNIVRGEYVKLQYKKGEETHNFWAPVTRVYPHAIEVYTDKGKSIWDYSQIVGVVMEKTNHPEIFDSHDEYLASGEKAFDRIKAIKTSKEFRQKAFKSFSLKGTTYNTDIDLINKKEGTEAYNDGLQLRRDAVKRLSPGDFIELEHENVYTTKSGEKVNNRTVHVVIGVEGDYIYYLSKNDGSNKIKAVTIAQGNPEKFKPVVSSIFFNNKKYTGIVEEFKKIKMDVDSQWENGRLIDGIKSNTVKTLSDDYDTHYFENSVDAAQNAKKLQVGDIVLSQYSTGRSAWNVVVEESSLGVPMTITPKGDLVELVPENIQAIGFKITPGEYAIGHREITDFKNKRIAEFKKFNRELYTDTYAGWVEGASLTGMSFDKLIRIPAKYNKELGKWVHPNSKLSDDTQLYLLDKALELRNQKEYSGVITDVVVEDKKGGKNKATVYYENGIITRFTVKYGDKSYSYGADRAKEFKFPPKPEMSNLTDTQALDLATKLYQEYLGKSLDRGPFLKNPKKYSKVYGANKITYKQLFDSVQNGQIISMRYTNKNGVIDYIDGIVENHTNSAIKLRLYYDKTVNGKETSDSITFSIFNKKEEQDKPVEGLTDIHIPNGIHSKQHLAKYLNKRQQVRIPSANNSPVSVNTKELVSTMIDRANSDRVKLITNEDLQEMKEGKFKDDNGNLLSLPSWAIKKNIKAFILNGTIYCVNDNLTEKAMMHEFTHIYLAGVRENYPKLYSSAIEKIYQELSSNEWMSSTYSKNYPDMTMDDLCEEVLSDIIGNYGTHSYSQLQNFSEIKAVKDEVKKQISDLFEIPKGKGVTSEVLNMDINEFAINFASNLVSRQSENLFTSGLENIEKYSKLVELKRELKSSNKLKEIC